MTGIPGLGTAVATQDTPNPLEFHFVISDETARSFVETGMFVQVKQEDQLIIANLQSLHRTNRYFSSPDLIHGSSQGLSVHSVYPAERWDYLIASAKVLGSYQNGMKSRSTKPILPGSKVEMVSKEILSRFLGIDSRGLNIGHIRQSSLKAKISMDRLLQKHLAILSISGGGKSYSTSVIIEEILLRNKKFGRPAVFMFDVHGEYRGLQSLSDDSRFRDAKIERIDASKIKMALGHMSTSDFGRIFPSMSYPQKRELSQVLNQLKSNNKPITMDAIINSVINREMNLLIKEALLGWLTQLKHTYLFSNSETPDLESMIKPGKLVILDLAEITSLWIKQIIVHYFLSRLFELRRKKIVAPVVSFIEEAHQFAPEIKSSASKSIIHTIAREGRKFLCSLVLISQRPVNLSTTALSQCNSHLIMRILNPHDLAYIGKTSEGITKSTLGMLTSLGVGEGLLVGEAVNYPIFVQIRKKLSSTAFDEALISSESIKYEKLQIEERL